MDDSSAEADRSAAAGARQALANCHAAPPGTSGAPQSLKISPLLDPEEAADSLAGLRAGLFTVGFDGYVQSELLPPTPESQKILQLFWRYQGKLTLFREGICQLAAVSALVLKHGWPSSDVRLEPTAADVGDVAYGVDIVVRDPQDGYVVICGEVKRSAAELRKMLDELSACLSKPRHAKSVCQRTNHPKADALWKLRPGWFWAVCPGTRQAFRVLDSGNLLSLSEVQGLPRGTD